MGINEGMNEHYFCFLLGPYYAEGWLWHSPTQGKCIWNEVKKVVSWLLIPNLNPHLPAPAGSCYWSTGHLLWEIRSSPHPGLHPLPVSILLTACYRDMYLSARYFSFPVPLFACKTLDPSTTCTSLCIFVCLLLMLSVSSFTCPLASPPCLSSPFSPLFLLLLLQTCSADHGGQAGVPVAAGSYHGHAEPSAGSWGHPFPGGQRHNGHPGQLLAAFSGGPRQGEDFYCFFFVMCCWNANTCTLVHLYVTNVFVNVLLCLIQRQFCFEVVLSFVLFENVA